MTPQRTERIQDHVIGGIVTLIGGVLLILLTGGWSAKENAKDHDTDVKLIRAEIQRLKDVICLDHPNAPQCKS